MADDVEEFIHEHRLERVTLIGHSMGAKVAMTLALRSPSLVRTLVSVDNAPVDATLRGHFSQYVQGLQSVEDAKVTNQIEADHILQMYEKDLSIRQFLLTNLVRTDGMKYLRFRIPIKILGASLAHMGDFPYKNPEEVRYNGPTLFLRGSRSHYVADDILPIIGRFFPRFELRDIDSGHWVISEKPEAFRQAVIEFIQRQTRGEE